MTKEQLGSLILDSERQMYVTAKGILKNDQDCGDAIQETIVKAFSKIQTLKKDNYAKTWLIRILINECHNILRKRKNQVSFEDVEWEIGGKTQEKKDYSELYQAVSSLKEDLRMPIVLYYIEDFSVKQKLVYVTVTYKNVSKQKINNLTYLGNLMLLNEKGHKYEVYTMDDITGEADDKIEGSSVARAAEMGYFDVQDERSKNTIKSLKTGESVTVNMAWIVNENDLDNMYLNLEPEGGDYAFTDTILDMGLVKL